MGRETIKRLPRSLRDPVLLAWVGVVRELREQRGWSLAELASQCGLSHQYLSLLEKHARQPSGETMSRISRGFGVLYSTTVSLAEQRSADWPERCQACNYCCVECGQLTCWNPTRGCLCSGR